MDHLESVGLWYPLMLQMDYPELRRLLSSSQASAVVLSIANNQQFWREKAEQDFEIQKNLIGIMNWRNLYSLLYLYKGNLEELFDLTERANLTGTIYGDLGKLLQSFEPYAEGEKYWNAKKYPVKISPEGILWIRNEKFNSDVGFWSALAAFAGVTSGEDTLLYNGYMLRDTFVNLELIAAEIQTKEPYITGGFGNNKVIEYRYDFTDAMRRFFNAPSKRGSILENVLKMHRMFVLPPSEKQVLNTEDFRKLLESILSNLELEYRDLSPEDLAIVSGDDKVINQQFLLENVFVKAYLSKIPIKKINYETLERMF